MNSLYFLVFLVGICLSDSNIPTTHLETSALKAPAVQSSSSAHSGKETKQSGTVVIKETAIENTNATISKQTESTSDHSIITVETTPSPSTPKPLYEVGEWNVTDAKGVECILISGKLAINLKNETDNNKTIATFRVPSNAPNKGSCDKECIEFELPNNASLHLMFGKNSTNGKFYVKSIKGMGISFIVANHTVTKNFTNENLHLFENPLENSYHCTPMSENLISQERLEQITLTVEEFQVQAFKNSTTRKGFDEPVDCEPQHTPDIVPIIVGCLLALLVILVLIAYLISRRRSQSSGYSSM